MYNNKKVYFGKKGGQYIINKGRKIYISNMNKFGTQKLSSSKGSIDETIKILIRQSARWALAAKQDVSPLISLLHANYGAAYLWALLQVASEEQIKNSVNIDLQTFKTKISEIQDEATQKATKACPQFAGELDTYLLQLAGDT